MLTLLSITIWEEMLMKNLKRVIISVLSFSILVFGMNVNIKVEAQEKSYSWTENVTIIKETEDLLIYIIEENDKSYKYYEEIGENSVLTSKFLIQGDEELLIEKYESVFNLSENTLEYQIDDKIQSFNKSTIINLSDSNQSIIEVKSSTNQPRMATASTKSKWVKTSSIAGMGYYQTSNGGGYARYSTMEKKVPKYNSTFNNYTKKVDSLISIERGTLISAIGLGGISSAIQAFSGKKMSLATVKKFASLTLKNVIGIGTAYNIIDYVRTYDQANKIWNSIPGNYYYWKKV